GGLSRALLRWRNRGMIGVRRGGLPIRRRLPACPTCRSKMAKFRRPIAKRPQVENLPYYDRRGLRLLSVGEPGNDGCTKRRIANPPQAASLPYMPKQKAADFRLALWLAPWPVRIACRS